MEVESIQEDKKENPLIFLDEQKEKDDKAIEESLDINTVYVDMSDINLKENDYFLFGSYGNGSALLKKLFFFDIKSDSKSFKGKFMYQGQDKNKRKILCAELFQLKINEKSLLILLTKSTFSSENRKYFIDFLGENKITFKNCICFDSISANDFIHKEESDVNRCYFMKNSLFKYECSRYFFNPNELTGDSAYFLRYCDFHDIPCLVLISVFNHYDIGFESTETFNEGLQKLDLFKDYINFNNILKKNNSKKNDIKIIFDEYNSNKKSYLS